MADSDPAARPAPAPGVDVPNLTRGFLFADLRDYTGYVETHGNRAGALGSWDPHLRLAESGPPLNHFGLRRVSL